ncbi:hypothetical protein [Shewanella algae]|uniref:hypothetical protein n=1 Tax=Shewanella algae TaxID=38313 RepID=UPI00223B8A41|nr:hypothetical protein [Shewanella algae]
MSKLRVALLVDEYFGGAKTKFGGYGFLARHLVAKYLPGDDIDVEVLLKKDCGKVRLIPKQGGIPLCLYLNQITTLSEM